MVMLLVNTQEVLMFKKKQKHLKKMTQQKTQDQKTSSQNEQSVFSEQHLLDDHGPVIIGNRKDRPKF